MTQEDKSPPPADKRDLPDGDPAYLDPPPVLVDPGPAFAASTRQFQGIPSLACGQDGRLWATWYGGVTPREDRNNYVILAVSDDLGRSWSDEKLVIDPDGPGPVRAFDPEIWLAPDGRLWLFWAQGVIERFETRSGVWAITANEADGCDAAWSEPQRLADGVMMCKPEVAGDGEWRLPISLWHRREAGSASMWVSRDQGRTWSLRGACDVPPEVRTFDEHMFVERQDGSIWMLVRTRYGIGQSVSTDGGQSWAPLTPSGLVHPSTRFFLRRLASGRLLLVRHNPPEGEGGPEQAAPKRSHLTANLSEDDGLTWPHSMMLDERAGVSYPDGDQADDGTIYVTYDHNRSTDREILMAAFSEEDVIAGRPGEHTRLRVLINQAAG